MMAAPGRPRFVPTEDQRLQVEQMVGAGMSELDMAGALRVARETLRQHFAEELRAGRAKCRAEVIHLLFRSARAGNVAAQKHLEVLTARAIAEAAFTEAEPTEKGSKLGKKEQAAQAATTAGEGTDWGDDLEVASTLN